MNGTPITIQQFDELSSQGIAVMYDCKGTPEYDYADGFGGFFETREGARRDIILLANNDGYFIRAREDLVKSEDGVFVSFCENIPQGKKLPNFEDVFEVKEL
jgi:hypothetical protein